MHESESRVVVRRGARELNAQEVESVSGALHTSNVCTVTVNPFTGALDSDTHPC